MTTRRDMLTLAIGASCITCILGAKAAAGPYARWESAERARATGAIRDAADIAEMRRARHSVQRQLADSTLLLAQRDSLTIPIGAFGEGEARLLHLVIEAADDAGVSYAGSQSIARDSSQGGRKRLRVRVRVAGDLDHVTQWIASLENGPPFLSLTGLTITQPDQLFAPGKPEVLHVEATVDAIGRSRT